MAVTRSHQDLVKRRGLFFAFLLDEYTIYEKADLIMLRCEIRSAFIVVRFHFYLEKIFICAKLIVE